MVAGMTATPQGNKTGLFLAVLGKMCFPVVAACCRLRAVIGENRV
jgi:hypothetical protein